MGWTHEPPLFSFFQFLPLLRIVVGKVLYRLGGMCCRLFDVGSAYDDGVVSCDGTSA